MPFLLTLLTKNTNGLLSLDSIGNGGFSHDFAATTGTTPLLQKRFEAFGDLKPSIFVMISFLLGSAIPLLGKIPTERNKLMKALSADMRSIAVDLLDRARKEKETLVDAGLDRSILGALGM
jgi:hypothetical protein